MNLIDHDKLSLQALQEVLQKPPLFTPGEAPFWNDPYISRQMLLCHLDPATDLASRRPETIKAIVDWLIARLRLEPGAPVLDLGCGPGLYTAQLADRALAVTGIDYSLNSLTYARAAAQKRGLTIDYRYQDYLTWSAQEAFQAILLIYYDFGVPADEQRDTLLDHIYQALKPGGFFAFDVLTPLHERKELRGTRWSLENGGFWRPGPHLVLEAGFAYRAGQVSLRQYAIVDESGKTTVYRIWEQYYTPDQITQLLESHGFVVADIYADLAGTVYTPDTLSLGIVAQRPG